MKFTIKKGKHFSKPKRFRFHIGKKSLEKKITFTSSCLYELNNEDDADVNKAFGFTTDLFGRNSVRIGWNLYRGINGIKSIRLFGYVHINGKRSYIPDSPEYMIGKYYSFNEPIECSIFLDNNGYVYFRAIQGSYKGENTIVKIPFDKKSWIGYYQNPYFGGNQTSPQNMIIIVE